MALYFIYKITNIKTNLSYIGKSVNPNSRFKTHLREAYRNKYKNYFHNSIRKYGNESFKLEIIESDIQNENDAYCREKLWIDKLNTISPHGYNSHGGGRGGTFNPSSELRKKLSDAKLGYTPWNVGKIMNISKRFNIKSFVKPKIRNSTYIITFDSGKTITVYNLSEFCKLGNYKQSNLSNLLNKKKLKKHKDIISIIRCFY